MSAGAPPQQAHPLKTAGDNYQMYWTTYKMGTVSNQIQPAQFAWTPVAAGTLPQLATPAASQHFVGITW